MKSSKHTQAGRRDFVFKVIPACALSCMFGKEILGMNLETTADEKHMFDREFPIKMTFREYIERQNIIFIGFAKAVQKRYGKDAAIDVIKEWATEFNLERGSKQAQGSPDRSLKSYTRMFSNPKDWEGLLNMEIVEDSDDAFEMRVSECLIAVNFIEKDASDIGYAGVCWGDYAWAEGFNPKIKLVRDKTLMQGHSCCNHRYVWTG